MALGEALTDRMLRLGFNQTSLASRTGVSVATIRKLQKGVDQGYEMATIYRLASALTFDPQTMYRMAHGEEPTAPLIIEPERERATHTTAPALNSKLERLSDRDRAYIEELVDRLLGEED